MIETIRNAWKIPELRKKILFTVFALLIFRLGSVVPVPFINSDLLGSTLNSMGGIFALLGAMNGTAFSMAAVFALGVQPYINSSIIIQLLTVAIPALERLQKDGGEEGRKKIAASFLRPSSPPSFCIRSRAGMATVRSWMMMELLI